LSRQRCSSWIAVVCRRRRSIRGYTTNRSDRAGTGQPWEAYLLELTLKRAQDLGAHRGGQFSDGGSTCLT
jgi:hypothetical protein